MEDLREFDQGVKEGQRLFHQARARMRPLSPKQSAAFKDAQRRLAQVQHAIQYLKDARQALARAKCPQTLKRVRLALTSAEGAERNAYCRVSRTSRPA